LIICLLGSWKPSVWLRDIVFSMNMSCFTFAVTMQNENEMYAVMTHF